MQNMLEAMHHYTNANIFAINQIVKVPWSQKIRPILDY